MTVIVDASTALKWVIEEDGWRLWENAWDEAANALCFPARQLRCRIDRLTRAA